VKHDSDSESEVVLRAVKQTRRIVIDLYRPDRDAIARANVDTTSKRSRKAGFAQRGIVNGTRACASEVVDVYVITSMRNTNKRVSEWLERSLRRVVLYLHASEKVEKT
jgi:hypothetical protein